MPRIGIAISGGGHRAGLFGLGVLLYLADAGKNRDVACVSSVSGGSLTNGYVAQAVDFAEVPKDAFWKAVAPLARRLARTGTFLRPSEDHRSDGLAVGATGPTHNPRGW